MKLSIIIAIYKVEKYVHACLESIFRQGLDDDAFEVILINDGTPDNSMEVIQDIIDKHDNIIVVNQENQGLSVVHNVGIAMAKGEYILMPDSDDLLIDNSLSKILEVALSTQADLVVADFLIMNDEEINNIQTISQNEFEMKEKTGEELFIEDLNPHQCYVWRTLFRRDFLISNHLTFVPGIFIQDVPFTHECYIKAKKCIRTPWLLNIYRRGHDSATSSFSVKKAKDYCTAVAKTWELTHIEGLSPKLQYKLREDIFISFSIIILLTVHVIEDAADRTEIVDFLRRSAPDLSFNNCTKQRIISFMFRHFPHLYIHSRYIYGRIIEDTIRPFYNHKIKKIIGRS